MNVSWNDVTEEDLMRLYYVENLSDSQIAALFGITQGKVTYKRRKLGISIKNKIYQDFIDQHGDLFQELNEHSKNRLLARENIDFIAKAITHFVFRNGPIEDMHANRQLSQSDMKTLNKYMVNRIAGLLTTIADNNWLQLELLLSYYRLYGSHWDKAEPDVEEFNLVFQHAIEDGLQAMKKGNKGRG